MPQQEDESSVRHLLELGYLDPDEVAASETSRRGQHQAIYKSAAELAASGKIADATRLLESLCTEDPNWVAPRQLLAEVYFRAGRFPEAQAQLDWLTYNGIESPRLSLLAGAIALSRREIASAIEFLEYAAYGEPEVPSVHRLLGTALLRAGRVDEAARAFDEAVRRNTTDARALDGLAAVCLRQSKFDDAADWALQALEQDMQLFDAHIHLGLALAGLNRPDDALKALETSVKIDPNRSGPYRLMAKIAREQLNEPRLAAQYREMGRDIVRRRK